jgi:uncharacterized protein YndB with AHSA1/START domain
MAIEVTIETAIARPPADVFARIADIAAWPAWLIATGIVAVTRSADGPISAGERLRIDQRAAGRAGTFDAEVTVAEPPRHLGLRGEDGNGVSIDIEAVLAPSETGTVLTWSIGIGLPARFRFFESMARPQVQRAAALDLEALRLRLESTPAA